MSLILQLIIDRENLHRELLVVQIRGAAYILSTGIGKYLNGKAGQGVITIPSQSDFTPSRADTFDNEPADHNGDEARHEQ